MAATATNGTATTADVDYVAASGTRHVPPGVTTQTFTVLVNGDTKPDPNETFTVTLSNVRRSATLGDGSAVGTIMNDDGHRTISIADVNRRRGQRGDHECDLRPRAVGRGTG